MSNRDDLLDNLVKAAGAACLAYHMNDSLGSAMWELAKAHDEWIDEIRGGSAQRTEDEHEG